MASSSYSVIVSEETVRQSSSSSSSSANDTDPVSRMDDQELPGTWTKKTGKSKRKTMSGESSLSDKDVQATKKMKEKTEPRFIVYLRGTIVKLTSRNPVSIEREIKTRFNHVESIHLRGMSPKITCKSEEQRNNIRGCTSLDDTSVVTSLPFSEERRRREAVPKLHRVAIGGVPVNMVEGEIKNEAGAALVKRFPKRNQSGMLMPTMTVMLAYNHEDEVPDKVSYNG